MHPPEGFFKLNWATSLDAGLNIIGVGVVIRDHWGAVRGALATTFSFISNSEAAKAMTAWKGVDFCYQWGFKRVIIEGDYKNVVSPLKTLGPCCCSYGQIFDDYKTGIVHLQSVVIRHICRESNEAAYVLARFALSNVLKLVWVEDCLPAIQGVVLVEQGRFI
jgi:hypothetical protein